MVSKHLYPFHYPSLYHFCLQILLCGLLALAVAKPLVYSAPLAAAYTAPLAAAYTAPVAYPAYSAYSPVAYSAYSYASPYSYYVWETRPSYQPLSTTRWTDSNILFIHDLDIVYLGNVWFNKNLN